MAEKKVPYQVNGRQFEGMIVYDDSVNAKRPAIFMQPDWKGVCGDTIAQARTVAGKDYVVLMADMFGLGYGDKPKTTQELMAGMMRAQLLHVGIGGSVQGIHVRASQAGTELFEHGEIRIDRVLRSLVQRDDPRFGGWQ